MSTPSNVTPTTIHSRDTVKTRVLIISDTHAADLFDEDEDSHAFRKPLPKADILLHCGDLTKIGKLHEYEDTIAMLSSVDAELKLVIAGNHDITLDEEFYAKEGRRMHRDRYREGAPKSANEIWTGQLAKDAGITYLEEGTYDFGLSSGAKFKVYASPYQPEFCNWAFPYFHEKGNDEDRFNPPSETPKGSKNIAQNPIPEFPEVDIIMTHGPPYGIRDETSGGEKVGCKHLLSASRRARPRLHAFGHIHEGWGAERVKWNFPSVVEKLSQWNVKSVKSLEHIEVEKEKVIAERAAYINASKDGPSPLAVGEETLMVNASIMDLFYRPIHAPWLVDIDLPVGT
ncbi:ser/Thr protein phosphatase family protein [Patellaria atrata CBS 101060]|uniref:Ser/Thr protein phosphatase family protein n=1 Tax=Patellaria atrata CBS 101060 TaxID=1346257 RepID=A0A9P4SBK5_9PEZI|nr:ser/Thr protein phosphatase family protein [Patellaria atrata CBS 101060]